VKRRLLALPLTCCALLVLPAVAGAAAVGVLPAKSCYRSGESLLIGGTQYTPNASVRITSDGAFIGSVTTDQNGAFQGTLRVGQRSGERSKTYTGTDLTNPANVASTTLRVTALDVTVRPRSGRPGRRVRVRARGFTTGTRLYAHIVRRGYRRNVRIGRLKGACRTLSARSRIFRRGTRPGRYTVQFDTRRRYSSRTAVRIRYSVVIFRRARASAAAAAGGWKLLR
jgi:hypothetical protein